MKAHRHLEGSHLRGVFLPAIKPSEILLLLWRRCDAVLKLLDAHRSVALRKEERRVACRSFEVALDRRPRRRRQRHDRLRDVF